MVSNVVYILNNYVVSWFQLNATEVALARGLIQVSIFGVVLLLKNRKIQLNLDGGTYFVLTLYFRLNYILHYIQYIEAVLSTLASHL